ncbi:MAG: GNAT family N-acetyltransferase [Ktedonobacteraceae bacterium]
MSHTADMKLRPIDPQSDFPRMAELYNTFEPEPLTAEELGRWVQQASPARIHQRIAAIDEQGQLVGFNNSGRDPWMPPGRFWIEVVVDPFWRKQGIGELLYTHALQFVQEQRATTLEAEVRDHMPDSLHFAQQRGFKIDRHHFESTLDLAMFDEARFAGTIEAVEASGIRFFTLANLGDTMEAQQRLYEINRRYAGDIPGRGESFTPFEQFHKEVFEAPWYRADCQIVAADGDRWIGMSATGYFAETKHMYNMMTGVEPAYRGRKIALALKLLSIRRARAYGAAYMRTNNDSQNAPILAVNRKLGYRAEPGKYLLLHTLQDEE